MAPFGSRRVPEGTARVPIGVSKISPESFAFLRGIPGNAGRKIDWIIEFIRSMDPSVFPEETREIAISALAEKPANRS